MANRPDSLRKLAAVFAAINLISPVPSAVPDPTKRFEIAALRDIGKAPEIPKLRKPGKKGAR